MQEGDSEFVDLKVSNDVDVTEALQERQHVLECLLAMDVHRCLCRGTKYVQVHGERTLENRCAVLRHSTSDAALKQVIHPHLLVVQM